MKRYEDSGKMFRKRYDSLASSGSASSDHDVNDIWADFASNGRDLDDRAQFLPYAADQQQSSLDFVGDPFTG